MSFDVEILTSNCRESANPQNATTLHLQNAAAKGSLGIPFKKCTCLNKPHAPSESKTLAPEVFLALANCIS